MNDDGMNFADDSRFAGADSEDDRVSSHEVLLPTLHP